ncbi:MULTISPECIES: hypothetical protein [Pseudomonas]|jgi:hypothetical protein|uniref:hypothetical protein n=1 Tax=Pseudomonas TaxID=286 RepID=UPI0007620B7A|nr:hypothetical protein [Pseudomonas sp. NBRC 111132]
MKISTLKYTTLAALFTFALAGCNDAEAPKTSATSQPAASYVNEGQAAVELPNGIKVGVDGKIIKTFIVENKNGKFQRQVIVLPAEKMSVEGSLYYTLAKLGYARKAKPESENAYNLSYIKKSTPPVHASYKSLADAKDGKAQTRLVLTWKLEDTKTES